MTVHDDDQIDALFDAAGRDSDAIVALDGAVDLLKQARDAKARLARLQAPTLRAELMRRRQRVCGQR